VGEETLGRRDKKKLWQAVVGVDMDWQTSNCW